MIKKTKYLYITLLAILFISFALDIIEPSEKFSFLSLGYFIVFIALSIFLISRGLFYKIDTNLYFGILLLISPAIQTLLFFKLSAYFYFLIIIFGGLTLSSLVIWAYFKDKSHKFLFFVFLGELIISMTPLCLTKIPFWYLIILGIVWLLVVIFIGYSRLKLKKKR